MGQNSSDANFTGYDNTPGVLSTDPVFTPEVRSTPATDYQGYSPSGSIDSGNSSANTLGLTPGSLAGSATSLGTYLPWSDQTDAFFPPHHIDKTRWDKVYPYRLLVIDVENGNTIVSDGSQPSIQGVLSGSDPGSDVVTVRIQTDASSITITPPPSKWVFSLPLTPEQVSVTDQYAITTGATFRGVQEEHGGVKFKIISAQGSTGVLPGRPTTQSTPSGNNGALAFIQSTGFGQNALNSFNSLSSSISKLSSYKNGGPSYSAPPIPTVALDQTGYYAAELLDQFLEQYVMAKKKPKNKGWRLVWDDQKRNQSYVVTPISLNLNKSNQRPGLHMYNFQLKAWKRINLHAKTQTAPADVSRLNSQGLQRLLNFLSDARQAVQSGFNLLAAVRADVEAPLTVLRQTTLLVQDLAGLIQTAAELPNKILKDYQSSIAASSATLTNIVTSATNLTTQQAASAIIGASVGSEGLTLEQVRGGNLGTSAAQASNLNPAYNVFSSPATNYDFFSQIPLNELTLTDAQKASFAAEVDTVRSYTINDLKQQRLLLRNVALDMSNRFGAGNALVDNVYNRTAPNVTPTAMTVEQSEIIEKMWGAIQALDILMATTFLDQRKSLNPLQYVGTLATANGIAFDSTSPSKVLVPIPYGLTMEEIAERYLGDPERYIEIVTLNGLRDPYIDEVGVTQPLMSNGENRFVTVPATTNLFIGQQVTLKSNTVIPFTRNVTNIQQLNDSEYLISLDGLADLDNLLLSDSATLLAYSPGTLNNQDQIYIPSNLPADPDNGLLPPTAIPNTTLVGLSKVDILLTDSMDIAIDSHADFRYSAGFTNLVQALKLKFSTEIGTILAHPQFGLDLKVGMSNSDLDMQRLFQQINTMITRDSRFSGVNQLQIALNGPVLTIAVTVGLAQQNGVVPITFSLDARTLAA
jgi:hypothetical protein